jgi:hypothetical protein
VSDVLGRIGIGLITGMATVTALAASYDWETIPAAWLIASYTLPSLVVSGWAPTIRSQITAISLYILSLVPFFAILFYALFSPEGHDMAVFGLVMYAVAAIAGCTGMRGWSPSD